MRSHSQGEGAASQSDLSETTGPHARMAGIFLAQRNIRHIFDLPLWGFRRQHKKFDATCQRACNGLRYCR